MYFLQDLIPEELHPPINEVAALLGWLVAVLLAGGIWFIRTREKERREELEEWKSIAKNRADKIDAIHKEHHAEMTAERQSKEDMAREVITLLQASTHVMEGLRNDAKELEAEHREWRDEVRRVHDECKAEIVRLSSIVERNGGRVPKSDG